MLNPAADADVDISLKNGGGLRTEIGSAVLPGGSNDPNDIIFSPPANNGVSEGHLRATLRFDNGLVRLTMTADELVTIIEHGLAEVAPGAEPGRFPQVGGMSFVYDPTQPAGSRLVDLVVDKGDADPTNDVVVVDNGVNVAPMGTTFNMVTLNFLANGGDSYPFASLSNPNRINYYTGLGFGETVDFPDGDLANDPGFNGTFSYTGGEQDAMAEFMSTFHPDNASAYNIAETPAELDTRIKILDLPDVEFAEEVYSVDENAGSIDVELSISEAPTADVSIEVSLMMGGSAVEGSDFTFAANQTVTFLAGTTLNQTISIPIIDNGNDNSDVYFALSLENGNGVDVGDDDLASVYILDDDTVVPAGDDSVLNVSYLQSYLVDANGTAEIGAHDPVNQYLFVTNDDVVEVLDFSDINNITPVTTLQQASFGGVQSVAVNGNIVAVAHAAQTSTDPGAVFFYELPDLTNVTSVTVGALPDMLTFTPDGTKVLVANEGEPNDDYTIDPEGSISVIDVSGGFAAISQASVTTLDFNAFDSDLANLTAAGVRIFGPGASVSQDLEPEYIAVSEDSQIAYAVLQENNAYATVDLTTNTITSITAFDLKDHSLPENSLDVSDETDFIFDASWPIFGMPMPDGMDSFNIGGVNYLITANEGDARDYDTYSEERKLDDSDYVLDPTAFPNADLLELESNLGEKNLTNASGDTDGDGDFDEIHVFGARSFSIYEADSGNFVYDSGNDFEVITAADPTYGSIFNASNSNNNFKNRSDNKGPEPEAVIVEELDGNYYAFILLERIGGIMVYDVTDPNAPVFLQYLNSRGAVEGDPESGDLGPEGIILVSASDSPNGQPLLVVTNEVSATLSIFTLEDPSNPDVQFNEAVYSVNENGSSINIPVSISEAPATNVSVDVSVKMGGSAVDGTHFNFSTQTVIFPAGSTANVLINIPIIDNTIDNSDVYFALEFENQNGVNIGDNDLASIYILDDDTVVPAGDPSVVDANYLTSYLVDANGTAEIGAYDPVNQYLFVTNDDVVEVLDFSDINNITPVTTLQQASFGGVQSVAVNGNIVAVAHAAQTSTDPGAVFFYELPGLTNVTSVTVGALPDMLTFTPDGTKVLVANEGEPNDDYTIDPEGSISVIDVSGGFAAISQASVTTLDFNAFDSDLANLTAAGVRIFGPGASVSQDLEPEYIAVSEDSQIAYAVLQENNAYATVDLTTNTITSITAFDLKDHSLPENSLDVSDETDFIFDASWPIFGMPMPDGMDSFNIGGVNYLITANEGDARDYDTYSEERKLDDSDYVLDPTAFPNADLLELESNLGEKNLTNASGDTDGDGDFDEIHVFGARSFSIYEADSGNFVYDSGNDFEVITAADPTYGSIFNASNSNNNFKNRSDNKGPEPEAVIVEEFNGNYYAFVLLERIGGVMIYDVTDPTAPVFLQYLNSRGAVEGADESGDLGPEGVILIRANESPNGIPLLVITNEVSATLSIYTLDNPVLSTDGFGGNLNDSTFIMYPNPASDILKFNQQDNYKVFDMFGRLLIESENTLEMNVSGLNTGMYVVVNSIGQSQKLVINR